jgi:thiamine-phosphate pyrophosphorylase
VAAAAEPLPERLRRARLYLCLEARPGGLPPEEILGPALAGGCDVVQLRDKEAGEDALLEAGATFRAACDEHGAVFIVNDSPALARAVGADGVHVGQDDIPPEAARAQIGDERLIGLSTHSPEELRAGLKSDADYLSVGPVLETPTKPGRRATGLDYVRHAAAHAGDRPWFAIGGIDATNVLDVMAAGARRVVVVRAIRDAPDPQAAARALRRALEGESDGTAPA